MPKQQNQKKGCKKAGRNKRPKGPISAYVRGTSTFESYAKVSGIKLGKKP